MMFRWTIRALLLGLLVALIQPVYAQGSDLNITITQVDGNRFPLVTLYVSITDKAGKPAVGLTQDEISVTEDGKPVEIVEFKGSGGAPVNTLLVLDRSGSMQGPKLSSAQQAATSFVELMRSQDQVGLLLFAGSSTLAQPLTSDKAALSQAIDSIQVADATALYDAVSEGLNVVRPVNGRKSLIVLSDGMDNRDEWLARLQGYGSKHELNEVIEQASASGVTLYTIGLGDRGELNEQALQQLAAQTGGTYYYAPSGDQLTALYRSLSQQFQTEYALTYRSPRAAYDGTRRNIEIAIHAGGGHSGSGSSTYMERHLLQVRSQPLAGLALSVMLLLALAGPLALCRRGVSLPSVVPSPVVLPAAEPKPPPAAAPVELACRACGTPLRPAAKFCMRCGQRQVP
jgi:VWFA-related protein